MNNIDGMDPMQEEMYAAQEAQAEMRAVQDALTEEEAGFRVDDDQKAEWCLQKIREAQAEKERWARFYTHQLEAVKRREDYRIAFFEEKLKFYFSTVPHKATKTQESYQLPSGKLVYKAQAPEFERKSDQLLPWVKQNAPGLVKVAESVDWAELKKRLAVVNGMAVTEDGEIVPGITVTDRPPVFKVEVRE